MSLPVRSMVLFYLDDSWHDDALASYQNTEPCTFQHSFTSRVFQACPWEHCLHIDVWSSHWTCTSGIGRQASWELPSTCTLHYEVSTSQGIDWLQAKGATSMSPLPQLEGATGMSPLPLFPSCNIGLNYARPSNPS